MPYNDDVPIRGRPRKQWREAVLDEEKMDDAWLSALLAFALAVSCWDSFF